MKFKKVYFLQKMKTIYFTSKFSYSNDQYPDSDNYFTNPSTAFVQSPGFCFLP